MSGAPTPPTPPDKRSVIVVQSDLSMLVFLCPLPGSMKPENVAQVESIVPSAVSRNICAIGHTALVTGQKKPMALAGEKIFVAAGQAIPFFGMLIGLAYIGHKVRVFDGTHPPLATGCKAADILIVDSAMRSKLPPDWDAVARGAMRNPNIFEHQRATFKLAIVRKVGNTDDRIEFQS